MKNVASGTVVGGALLFTAGLGLAGAQPDTAQDDLVNVSIGNVGVLEDVRAPAASQIAAGVCDADINAVTAQVTAVDTDGVQQTVCTNELGAIDIVQNGPGQSENAPGQAEETPTSAAPEPTEAPAEEGS